MFKNKSRLIQFTAAILVVVAALIFLGKITLDKKSTGIENYSGIQRQAAQLALEFDKEFDSDYPLRNWSKARVEKVIPTSEDTSISAVQCTNDPNDVRYYSVVITRYLPFGLKQKTITYRGCNFAG